METFNVRASRNPNYVMNTPVFLTPAAGTLFFSVFKNAAGEHETKVFLLASGLIYVKMKCSF